MSPFIMILLMLVFFWLVVLQPQMRERKATEEMLRSLKKGDRVITIGGLYGTIVSVADHDVVLKVDDKTRIRCLRRAIHQRLTEKVAAETAKSEEEPEPTAVPAS